MLPQMRQQHAEKAKVLSVLSKSWRVNLVKSSLQKLSLLGSFWAALGQVLASSGPVFMCLVTMHDSVQWNAYDMDKCLH
jgi:hypothetical protein